MHYLFTKAKDINSQDKDGSSFLHLACWSEKVKIVKLLLLNGADTRARDKDGRTALDLAKERSNGNMISILEESENTCTLLNAIAPAMNKMKGSNVNIVLFIALHYIFEFLLFIFILPRKSIYLDLGQEFFAKAVCAVVLFLLIYTFGILIFTDSVNSQERERKRISVLKLVENRERLSNICFKCSCRMDLLTRHCVVCDKCIFEFDHHCFWVNNCIGKENINYFYSFLVLIVVNLSLNIYYSFVVLRLKDSLVAYHIVNYPALYGLFARKCFCAVQLAVAFVFVLPVGYLLCIHANNRFGKKERKYKQILNTEDSRNEYLLERQLSTEY